MASRILWELQPRARIDWHLKQGTTVVIEEKTEVLGKARWPDSAYKSWASPLLAESNSRRSMYTATVEVLTAGHFLERKSHGILEYLDLPLQWNPLRISSDRSTQIQRQTRSHRSGPDLNPNLPAPTFLFPYHGNGKTVIKGSMGAATKEIHPIDMIGNIITELSSACK